MISVAGLIGISRQIEKLGDFSEEDEKLKNAAESINEEIKNLTPPELKQPTKRKTQNAS